ncbi:phosphoglycerate dehydrogenase [Fictibacillus sp. KIGAM418]|uniref:D-3-phosphoglycerate dehydrogenase n=1 Tax=Fictibacillus marinisediminis TaxID=2878389 RepID=A0A9X1XAY7_9BACL|nr:phosphoglycerate dehydrogenase [Fictibacillus marinisediminis]MCK6257552.1 phosphoglycerate dehydrogenase [Fictibacillus marinisediminis]
MFRVLAADSIAKEGMAALEKESGVSVIYGSVEDVQDPESIDALVVRSATKVTKELLSRFHNIRIVARAGVGVDNIDIDAATQRGVLVINAPDGNTISTAEHTFAMIMAILRKIPQANQSIKEGKWNRSSFTGAELSGKVLGIVGLGRIGTELAKRARAFDSKVQVFDPFLTTERAKTLQVVPVSLDELLESSDIITVHTPLTKETKNLINTENLSKTKQGVYLINCARGGILDEEALYTYLSNGHIAGCALDVFVQEPAVENRLVHLPNVIATPHIAASTAEAQMNVAEQVAKEILTFSKGKPVKNAVNLPAVSNDDFQKIYPYYELAKVSGQFLSQSFSSPIKEIKITFAGTITELDTGLVSRGLLSGFLQPRVDRIVNDINATLIAKEQGFSFGEKYSTETQGYENIIEARVIGETESFSLQSTYINGYGPRVVNINGYSTDFVPEGFLIYIEHVDKPGVIGRVGKLLGDLEVNIAAMQVGRKMAGGEAIMMLTFDKELDQDVLLRIKELSDVVSATTINL